jgi:cytochrome c biogenesis protein CcdA/glutaredoxin
LYRLPDFLKRGQRVASALLAMSIMAAALGMDVRAEPVVRFYYFYDSECDVCEETHREVLEPLLATYGDQVMADERDIDEESNFLLLLGLEKAYEVESVSIPEVFIGDDALIGGERIREQLRERIEHYLAQGGVDLPAVSTFPALLETPGACEPEPECPECEDIHEAQRTAVADRETPIPQEKATPAPAAAECPLIYAAYFYQVGCDVCDRAENDLAFMVARYPQLTVQRFDVQEAAALHEYLSQRANVPGDKHLTAPALFVGDSYLIGEEISAAAIEALIEPRLDTGAAEPWAGWEANQKAAEETIVERFRSLGIFTILGAGLLDGVNPCAFATMIFLVSYLAVRKREGRELLATGAAFTCGVFLAYLGVGFGFLRFLTSLPILNALSKWIYGATIVLCLALAWGSFVDYRRARKGRLEDMGLKLPERMRGWIRRLIREGSRSSRFVLASVAVGFGVSIVELACTGQVYLPTIIFVLGIPEWRARATLALLLYNTVFVVPLIGVFLLVYYGTTSQQLTDWMTEHAATVKLGTAALFLLLAGWLGYSLVVL